jgi:hypothetical protein
MIGVQWLLQAGHELSTETVEGVDDSTTVGFRLGASSPPNMLGIIKNLSLRAVQGGTAMVQRHQRGWLKKETRSQGETGVFFYRRIEIPMAREWKTRSLLVWLETSPTNAAHELRSSDYIFNSIQLRRAAGAATHPGRFGHESPPEQRRTVRKRMRRRFFHA